jgi:hypothetical protein
MTRTRRLAFAAAACACAVAALAYLHDPPWAGDVTSGLRAWDYGIPGMVFRWTNGRATFFIPADARAVMIPMRAGYPSGSATPVTVDVYADGRFLATIALPDPGAWVRDELPLGNRPTRRRFRRIDLRVSRVVGPQFLGVMIGPATVW